MTNVWLPSNDNVRMSANFTAGELRSKDGGPSFVNQDALDALQRVRDAWGRPMYLVSAYRTPSHNSKVGGAVHSYHQLGVAFDVSMDGVEYEDRELFVELATQEGFRGIGRYRSFCHIDRRLTTGNLVQWGNW